MKNRPFSSIKIKESGLVLFQIALILFLVLNSQITIGQEIVFDQYIRNNKVGTLSVFIHEDRDRAEKTIRIESKVSVSMLFLSTVVNYEGKSVFRSGKLIMAEIQICRDGSPYQDSEVHWRGDHYLAVIDGSEINIKENEILFSSLLLYAKEPRNTSRVFAEIDGVFNRLEHKGRGKYELHIRGSRNNYYTYRNGELVEAKLDHWLAPIYLKRQ